MVEVMVIKVMVNFEHISHVNDFEQVNVSLGYFSMFYLRSVCENSNNRNRIIKNVFSSGTIMLLAGVLFFASIHSQNQLFIIILNNCYLNRYLLKVNKGNISTIGELYSKLTSKCWLGF